MRASAVFWSLLWTVPVPIPATAQSTPSRFAVEESVCQGIFIVENPVGGTREVQVVPVMARVTRNPDSGGNAPTTVKFAGKRPPGMADIVTAEASRLGGTWEGGWGIGQAVSVTGPEAVHELESDSAALAIALALDGLVTGTLQDPEVAVTGILEGSGPETRLLPVESLGRKLRAAEGKVRIVVVPSVNRDDLTDLLVSDGIGPWLSVQVFVADDLAQVRRIAVAPSGRDALVNEALKLFEEARNLLGKSPRPEILRQRAIYERLRKVLELEPGHASARMLLAAADQRVPVTMSLRGSLRILDGAIGYLEVKDSARLTTLHFAMRRQRPVLAPEILPVWDAVDARLEAMMRQAEARKTANQGAFNEWKAKEADAARRHRVTGDLVGKMPEFEAARARLAREP